MNRSAIDGEVEYHLKMQERAALQNIVAEDETKRPGLIARLLARLQRPALRMDVGRGKAGTQRKEAEGEDAPKLGWR